MIDYLAEALTEGREEELLSRGRRVTVRPLKGKKKEDPETDGTRPQRDEGPARTETSVPAEDPPGDGKEESLPPEEWIAPELRAVFRQDRLLPGEERPEAAGTILQALSRTGRSLRALRGGPGVLTVTLPDGGGETADGTDLETLDLAMQRDARRYDGGFPLY